MLDQVEEEGLDAVSLDEAAQRLKDGEGRRFVCFTSTTAIGTISLTPIRCSNAAPCRPRLCADRPPVRTGELWWLALEEVVARADEIEFCRNGELWRLPTATVQEKERSYDQIYWWLRSVDESTQRRVVRTLSDRYEIDTAALCRNLVMTWDEIRGGLPPIRWSPSAPTPRAIMPWPSCAPRRPWTR